MLNAFSRDIRSVRAQENIGVHLGAPLLVEYFPEKRDPYLSSNRRRPSTADLEAHSWINERPVVGHFSDVAGLTDDVGSWGKADSQPTSLKRRD